MNVRPPSLPSRWRWLVLLFVLSCAGCGGGGDSLASVRGKVLDKQGQPAKGAVVSFHPKGGNSVSTEPSVGVAGEDGTFTLETGKKSGAPVGEYTVTIIWPEEVAPRKAKVFPPPESETRDRLRGAYANAKTSPFKVQIKAGDNQLEPFLLK